MQYSLVRCNHTRRKILQLKLNVLTSHSFPCKNFIRYSIRLLSRTTINDHGLAVNVQISRNLKTLAYGANPHLILHSVPRSKLCFKQVQTLSLDTDELSPGLFCYCHCASLLLTAKTQLDLLARRRGSIQCLICPVHKIFLRLAVSYVLI